MIESQSCISIQNKKPMVSIPCKRVEYMTDSIKSIKLIREGMLLVMITCLPSCNTIQTSAHEPMRLSKEKVTFEKILLWPLEGSNGADRTATALRRVFAVTEARPSLFSGQGPVVLPDGYVLAFVYLGADPRDIDVGVREKPCFSAQRAAAVADAVLNPVINDAHGVDRGKTYDATRNGMWVSFSTTPLTYQCVTAIHIRSIKERAHEYQR